VTLWGEGRWSLDVRGDELADIRCDGRLVLRAIRAVARDADWATAWPAEVRREVLPNGLALTLRVRDLGLDLAGTLRVTVDGDRLAVDLDLTALSDSPTNRTGLVVLHPPQLAGEALEVTHPDGVQERIAFPVRVSPHQPARGIAALAWEAGGLPLRLELSGEVFEMEDQRNWTDASFKTYSRPLDLPFPYVLRTGERVRQRLELTAGAAVEELTLHEDGAMPRIGAAHLDLELADPDWPTRLEAALAQAHGAAEPLALWVVSPSPADPAALAELGRLLGSAPGAGPDDGVPRGDGAQPGGASPDDGPSPHAAAPRPALRWAGIVDAERHVTTPELAAALRAVLPAGLPLVAGARSHFTELNREWETVLAAAPDALAFATTPLFHTLEAEQLVEAVAMQRLLAEQLTARAPELPVHIGPITLRARFANVATRPQPVPAPAPPVDPRAGTTLHEAWTIASAAALAVPGVASLTYEQVPAPLAALGAAGPVGAAAQGADGAGRAGRRGAPDTAVVTGRSADGLLWAIGDGRTLLLANLSARPRRVGLPDHDAPIPLDPASWRSVRSSG
jgi:hypothetical protein